MTAYANLHIAFEQMRVKALAHLRGSPIPDGPSRVTSESPRVLVLGPENSGKTSACKVLVNYAARSRMGWVPVLVNTDPREVSRSLSLPFPSLHFSSVLLNYATCVGRMGSPRSDHRRTRRCTYHHTQRVTSTWSSSELSTYYQSIQRAPSAGVLLWTYGRAEESSVVG